VVVCGVSEGVGHTWRQLLLLENPYETSKERKRKEAARETYRKQSISALCPRLARAARQPRHAKSATRLYFQTAKAKLFCICDPRDTRTGRRLWVKVKGLEIAEKTPSQVLAACFQAQIRDRRTRKP
jgi:hypothetical protein